MVAGLVEHLPVLLTVHEASGGAVVVHNDVFGVAVVSVVVGTEGDMGLQDVLVPMAPRVRPLYNGVSLQCCVVAQAA